MKVINFGAGPAKLPEEVLQKAQRELLDYEGTGISVMEMSHRLKDYTKLNDNVEQSVRDLLNVPVNYKIIFLQGGATGQFAAVPLNLMHRTGRADYFVTGSWSAKAAKEAAKYGKVNLVLPKTEKYSDIPDKTEWNLDPTASYVYYCTNETIHGIEFPYIPEVGDIPLVADMSSNFLSRPIDVSKFGVIFACAQKNIGPPGVTVVIVREDLLGNPHPHCPIILDFTAMAKDKSLYNTPPTFSVYIMGLVFEWTKAQGGVEEMEERAKRKSSSVYRLINESNGFYKCLVRDGFRSRMNVPFKLSDPGLEAEFLSEVKATGMLQLEGHRSVGGVRVSLYNAITEEEVRTLVQFMENFMKRHRKD